MTSAADTDPSPADIRTDYLAQMRQKRMLNMILLLIFAALMVAGFYTADARNAGGFWNGWPHILDFPADVVGEAYERCPPAAGLFREIPALAAGNHQHCRRCHPDRGDARAGPVDAGHPGSGACGLV